jgi:RNA polymerase sigma-70 factor (ECF subfamily)
VTDFVQLSDEDLFRRSAGGDEGAFSALYRRRQAGIYRYALHMIGSAATAEEVTQDVFLALLRNFGGYDPGRGSVSAFLYGIARNHIFKSWERNAPSDALDEEMPSSTCVWADFNRQELIESVRQAVTRLPAAYREPVVLCDLQEMSYVEASEVLGVPVGTVRSRLSRGRALLAEKLKVGCLYETR